MKRSTNQIEGRYSWATFPQDTGQIGKLEMEDMGFEFGELVNSQLQIVRLPVGWHLRTQVGFPDHFAVVDQHYRKRATWHIKQFSWEPLVANWWRRYDWHLVPNEYAPDYARTMVMDTEITKAISPIFAAKDHGGLIFAYKAAVEWAVGYLETNHVGWRDYKAYW